MDHLPLPRNPIHPPVQVPCTATEDYDAGPFETYPDRQGWKDRTIKEWHIIFEGRQHDLSAFLQKWLYFGLMSTLLGEPIALLEFTRERNACRGDRIISTLGLLPVLEKWIASIWSEKGDDALAGVTALPLAVQLHSRLQDGLARAGRPWNDEYKISLIEFVARYNVIEPRDGITTLSVSLLIDILLQALSYQPGNRDVLQYATLRRGFNFQWEPEEQWIYQRMRSDGWCPSELHRIFERFTTVQIFYISHFKRPNPAAQHPVIPLSPSDRQDICLTDTKKVESRDREGLCSQFQCSVTQLNEDTYEPTHTAECSKIGYTDCFDVIADQQEISKILKAGGFPLIRSINDSEKSCQVSLVSSLAEEKLSYVAISHVWSDRLGNLKQNSLPRCQMLRLSRLIRNLPHPASNITLFWIDTICCPPDSANMEEAQTLALSKMRQTYEGATAVLVLDSWLEGRSICDTQLQLHSEELSTQMVHHAEALAAIASSTWNTRLWNLQEGALARLLFVYFADMPYDVDDGLQKLLASPDLALELSLKMGIARSIHEIRGSKHSSEYSELGTEAKLITLANALRFRSTSVKADEPICLGNLLDLDTFKIVQAGKNQEKRMAKFWSLLEQIPKEFLFQGFPRLEVDGFRWAPMSLLYGEDNPTPDELKYSSNGGGLKRTDEGLLIRTEGLLFSLVEDTTIGLHLHVRDERGLWYNIKSALHEARGTEESSYETASGQMFESRYYKLNVWQLYGHDQACFIPRDGVFLSTLGSSSSDTEDRRASPGSAGILASRVRETDEVIYVRYLCQAVCFRLDAADGEVARLNQLVSLRLLDSDGDHSNVAVTDPETGQLVCSLAVIGNSPRIWCVD